MKIAAEFLEQDDARKALDLTLSALQEVKDERTNIN
jgi:hypothetical protein